MPRRLGFAIAGLMAAAMQPAPVEARQDLDSHIAARLDAHIDAMSDLYGTAGASVAILVDDEVVYTRHRGSRNIEAGLPVNGDTAYTIWSMSKLFFDIEFQRAVDSGAINLDWTLGEVFTDLPEDWAPVTLHQLWSHVSGLPDFIQAGFPPDAEAALAVATAEDIPARPGTESRYNQTNFLLLGQLLERVTGTPYRDLVRINQLAPLGLDHTSFSLETAGSDQSLNYRSSRGDPAQLAAIEPPQWPQYIYTSVGLEASLNDLVRWSQALVREELADRGRLLELWHPVYLPDGTIAEHAHGWEVERRGDFTAAGHGGGGRVNLRQYWNNADPGHTLTVIYLDNGGLQNFNHRGLSARLADMVWPGIASPEEIRFGALAEAARDADTTATAADFLRFAVTEADPTGRRETEINRIGYAALRLHGPDAAIPVFELEVSLFPESWNAQDSLAEAYLAGGRIEDALFRYRQADRLNPGSDRIETLIAGLEADLAPQ